jgi:DNA polymerase-1
MSNPNGQNVPTQENDEGHSARSAFGPAPGRELWSLDYSNLELRIPAYEAREEKVIALFEREDEPPYYGSYHLLVAHMLFPKEFEEAAWNGRHLDGRLFKASRKQLYKTVKNTDLAKQYASGKATTDRTAKREGAFEVLVNEFQKTERLAARYVAFAEKHGYVETIPDRTVDPARGFPVEVVRGERGRVSPTEPFNYHVQPTGGQCINRAMVRCAPVLEGWERATGKPHFIALQVHDELLFDFPAGGRRNLPKVERLKAIMEASGDDIGVPLKVNVAWHPRNWGKAEDVHA